MDVVTKYRKKPLFRIISTGVLALLAGLILAPGFGANAKTGPLLAGGKDSVENNRAVDARPAAQPKAIPDHAPQFDKTSAPNNEREGEPAPVAQPEQNDEQSGFEEETSFAIGEPAEQHGYAYQDAARFAALGSGGSDSSGGSTKSKSHKPKLAATSPTQNPQDGDSDINPDDTSSTGPSDQPDTGSPHDDDTTELPVASVPEPSSVLLLAVGLIGLAVARRYYS